MRLRYYVRKKKVIKRILTSVLAIILAFGGVITGDCYQGNESPKHNVVMSHETLKINNKVRYASEVKIVGRKMKVGATAYCGDTITSTGVRPIEGTTIAVDPKIIPYGTKVYIPKFNRIFIAQDCGSAIKGNRIDIFMNSYDRCMEWGYRTIEIYILD